MVLVVAVIAGFVIEIARGQDAGRTPCSVPWRASPTSPRSLSCGSAADGPARYDGRMARVIVDVMPKPEILDPQGKAVHGALPRLGFDGIIDVRQGKRFELEVDEADEATLAEVREIAETLLSNPVIEDYS